MEIGQAFDGFYCLSQRAAGAFLDSLDADGLRRLRPALFRTLDAMRQVDVSDSDGFGIWDASGNGRFSTWHEALLACALDLPQSRTHGWRARLAQSSIGPGPFEEAFAVLQRLLPFCPEVRHVVHSDLLNFNVLVRDDGISAVIDWGSSLYGDFLYDVAWLTLWQPWYSAWQGIDIASAALDYYRALGIDLTHFAERLRCYELHIGLDGIAYQAWKGGWDNVAWTTRRTLELARSVRL
jgi:hygromycin-B 4-O-kinase